MNDKTTQIADVNKKILDHKNNIVSIQECLKELDNEKDNKKLEDVEAIIANL
jgi:hypothetical protein